MKRDMEGKVALVTGGGGGIGDAVCHDLADNGAKVLVVDSNLALAEATARAIRESGGTAMALEVDVADPSQCEAMVRKAEEAFGALHYAVNNAGVSGVFGEAAGISVEEWRRVVAINLDGVFYGMKYQLPSIERAGGGAIVNTASIYAHLGLKRLDAYTASKHGVLGLTRSAALEYATRKVRINAVSPGPILTPMARAHPDQTAPIAALTAIKRMGEPIEIAKAVSFLLSPDASFIIGQEIVVDGGVMLN